MPHPLPYREREILRRYAAEVTQEAIAAELRVSRRSVIRWLQGHGCAMQDEVRAYVERILRGRPDLDISDDANTIRLVRDTFGVSPAKARAVAAILAS